MSLQDAPDLLAPAVAKTIAGLTLTQADAAAVKLAERYAAEIDDSYGVHTIDMLGPKLLAVLESLGATPAARARLAKGGKPPDAAPSQLDRLRAARSQRR